MLKDVEDDICLSYCPVLFVVGENAVNAKTDALKYLRQNMIGKCVYPAKINRHPIFMFY